MEKRKEKVKVTTILSESTMQRLKDYADKRNITKSEALRIITDMFFRYRND